MSHRFTVALGLAVTALVATGCGVPVDDQPRAVADDEIPDVLVAAPTTTSTPESGVVGELYFVELVDDQSVLTTQMQTLDDRRPTTAIEALVATVPEELDEGVRTDIPVETRILGVELSEGTLTIDLSPEFQTVSGDTLIQATAQMVFTATVDGDIVESVRFTVEGDPITVQADDGEEIDEARRRDYPSLNPDLQD